MKDFRKRMISGIKPSGHSITLGNYIGALKEFVKYQDSFDLYVFVADLHALTLYINPEELRQNTKNLIATYLAAGLDPKKCTIFKQSDVAAHNQLEWVLTCNTDVSELTKMPQFKNYQETHKGKATPAGMQFYPSLMNADILLYDTDYVPVGIDQLPHIELARDIAEKFNKLYGETFKLPEPLIAKTGAKIMSLSDPTKKMSKSVGEADLGTIYILDDEQTVRNKIKKAKTDSECRIYYNPDTKPGISNLLTIMSCLTNKPIEDLVEQYKTETNYGKFKNDIADIVWNELSTLQSKINDIKNNGTIEAVLEDGQLEASYIANNKIEEIYKKIGLR